MSVVSFVLGFLCGLALVVFRSTLDGVFLRLRFPLGEDETYLLCAARAAGGRLCIRPDPGTAGPPWIRLKEIANSREMENKGQLERLLARKLVSPDPSGTPGRYLLTPQGWNKVRDLPSLPLEVVRTGAWFNSISSRHRRHFKR